MKNLIEVKNVSKSFDGFAIKDISFTMPKGCILGMIGENGAGKTTTIQLILNILKSDQGKIQVFGRELSVEDKEQIGVVFSDEIFYDTLQLSQINTMMKQLYKQWEEPCFHQYCELFQLPDKKMIKDYSRGMKVKLQLAIAFSHHSTLLILDEPTSGLDALMRDELLDLLLDFMQEEEHGVLISSHISSDLEKIADYIMFLQNGTLRFIKEKDTLMDTYGIVHCKKSQLKDIKEDEYICYLQQDYSVDLLVENRKQFGKQHHDMVIEQADIDHIILMYAKGETKR